MKAVIKDFPNYIIFDDGRIYSKNRHKNIKSFIRSRGYMCVSLSKNGIKKNKLLHRLLAEAFISNPNNKLEVNHINGIKTDNSLNNLEWCSRSENQIHAWKIGLKIITKKMIESGKKVGKLNKNKLKTIKQIKIARQNIIKYN